MHFRASHRDVSWKDTVRRECDVRHCGVSRGGGPGAAVADVKIERISACKDTGWERRRFLRGDDIVTGCLTEKICPGKI